jgi:hypothetical protein
MGKSGMIASKCYLDAIFELTGAILRIDGINDVGSYTSFLLQSILLSIMI